jgi:hypothetical protein
MDPNDAQNEKSRGQIVVEVTYKPLKEEEMNKSFDRMQSLQIAPEGTPPGGGLLVIIVHEAQDIEGKYHTNPHVRLTFKGEERKTKVLIVFLPFSLPYKTNTFILLMLYLIN